jgi:SNF2 family DNA or RNA helicase
MLIQRIPSLQDADKSQFLYRATTGLIDLNAHGCIMADEMGLGKTVCPS